MPPLLHAAGWRERARFHSQRRKYDRKIKRAIRAVRRNYRHLKPPIVSITFFGATNVGAMHLKICLFFKDDNALFAAYERGYFPLLHDALLAALSEQCYPLESLSGVNIQFLSRKAVRAAGGIWTFWR